MFKQKKKNQSSAQGETGKHMDSQKKKNYSNFTIMDSYQLCNAQL